MLTVNPIPNLISGVSQQADSMKFPSQAVEQINASSHIVEGLIKRPPTRHVRKLLFGSLNDCKTHPIYRDAQRRYVAVFYDNGVSVFDTVDGTQKPVNYVGSAQAYLATTSPSTDLSALSLADYTFVLNRTKVVALDAAETDAQSEDALVVVRQGAYGQTYKILINGTSFASHTTSVSDALTINTDTIAAALVTAWGSHAGYTITRSGSVLKITKTTGTFTVTVEDGASGNNMTVVHKEVTSFTKLPTVAPHGFLVKITGEPESQADDYWVGFVTPNGDTDPTEFIEGKWVETIGPEVQYQFDLTTMPHVLVHETDGTFTFREAAWLDRQVGDDDSAPVPSFVGHTINNLLFFRNRLGFLSEENVILSESAQFYNFWRTTVTTILDADTVDVAASHNQVSLLYHGVPYFEQLVVMGEKVQFSVKGGQESLTTKNVAISPATEIDIATGAAPVLVGKNLFIGFNRGDYTGVWEYFVAPDTDRLDAEDLTIGNPSYIPGSILELAATESEKSLFVRTDESANTLYIYKYYTNGGERVQSAWSKWVFEDAAEIKGMAVFGNSLYLLVYRDGDGLCLERIDLQSGLTDPNSTFTTLLDRRVGDGMVGTYDSVNDKTSFYLPYSVSDTTLIKVVGRSTSVVPGGQMFTPESVGTDGVVVLDGDLSSQALWFGVNYEQVYRMSKPFLRADTNSNRITSGRRYQIRRGIVQYHNSLYFKVRVTPEYRTPFTHVFTGKVFGTPLEEVGQQSPTSGSFQFAVMTQNSQLTVELINDLPFPSALTTVDWIGEFTPYGVRG